MVSGLTMEEARELLGALQGVVFSASSDDVRCPRCGGTATVRKGHDRDGGQRWLCYECGRTFNAKTVQRLRRRRR